MKTFLGVGLALALAIVPAHAANYSGQLRLVQIAGGASGTTRFMTVATPAVPTVSLYASGPYEVVMLQAFFRKANMSLSYNPTPCLGGITGICGRVVYISVDISNL